MMDGIARVNVDPYVMEYVMHCMYDTFLKLQQGLRVSISWRKDDDSVMLTSTSRPATRDLHQALNRFFVMYNAVTRNLTFEYCQLSKYPDINLSIVNQIRDRYPRINIQKTNNKGEIKIIGFKNEITQVLSFIREYVHKNSRIPEQRTIVLVDHRQRLPRQENRTPPDDHLLYQDELSLENPKTMLFSKSFEKKISSFKSRRQEYLTQNSNSPPSRYSTSEIRRLQQSQTTKKTLTLPKINARTEQTQNLVKKHHEIRTTTGLIVSTCLQDAISDEPISEVLVSEISPTGRLSDDIMWMVAKQRSFELTKIIRLHIALYGQVSPSRVIVTPGFRLPYTHIIHVATPSWEDENPKKSLRNLFTAYKNVIRIADTDLNATSISIPILGRCSTAGRTFPEHQALAVMRQSVVGVTKSGLQHIRHLRILCSRQRELNFVKTKLFPQLMFVTYDSRYLSQQQQRYFRKRDEEEVDIYTDDGALF
uniref:uncharacterized protein LOC120344864 n=1 Tax=Styela clava TaxID=7725 RepID=UPI00193A458D|nr:uncharacterized protein LOC120344864 [Styela clava]